MIAVNGEKLNMTDRSNQYVKEVLEGFEIIREKIKFPVMMKYTSRHISKKNPLIPGSREERAMGVSVMLSEVAPSTNGLNEWTYFTTVRKRQDKDDEFQPKRYMFSGDETFTEKDIELVYFLLFKSKKCEPIAEYSHLQNLNNGPKSFKLVMKEKDEQVREDLERMIAEAKMLIYDKNPDVGLGDEKLIEISKTYNIKGLQRMSMSEIRNVMNDLVTGKKDINIVKSFLELSKAEDTSDLEVFIQTLVENNVIKHSTIQLKGTWKWVKIQPGEEELICRTIPKNDPVKQLVKFLSHDENKRHLFFEIGKMKLSLQPTE